MPHNTQQNMKFLTLSFLLIVTGLATISAQNNSSVPDQRIIDAYGTTYTNKLIAQSPQRIAYLNYFLDHSYVIVERASFAGEKMAKVSTVDLNNKHTGLTTRPNFDVNSFNVLQYNFKRNRKIKTQYRIDNTNKVLVFYSEEEITNAFNQSK